MSEVEMLPKLCPDIHDQAQLFVDALREDREELSQCFLER
jgi:hypothetical protein